MAVMASPTRYTRSEPVDTCTFSCVSMPTEKEGCCKVSCFVWHTGLHTHSSHEAYLLYQQATVHMLQLLRHPAHGWDCVHGSRVCVAAACQSSVEGEIVCQLPHMPTLWSLQAESLDSASSQPVAIKALSLRGLRGDWKALELFQREARTLEALQHPGIPRYLEYFEVDTPRDKGFYLVQVTTAH